MSALTATEIANALNDLRRIAEGLEGAQYALEELVNVSLPPRDTPPATPKDPAALACLHCGGKVEVGMSLQFLGMVVACTSPRCKAMWDGFGSPLRGAAQ